MTTPIDFAPLLSSLKETALANWAEQLPQQIEQGLSRQRYGDLPGWYDALTALPAYQTQDIDLERSVTIGSMSELSNDDRSQIEKCLKRLIPWRKGPYDIFGIKIDTEWRSDWKWERLSKHIESLNGRNVLDVGCGNGYHCLRMHGAGARRVIGIDPSPRFVVQYYMLKHFMDKALPVDVLPVGIEALPSNLNYFDTTFSMGVLYHRRSPMDHLLELRDTLRPGGQLVLETLVIEGGLGEVLVPEGRYGKMNNVWFVPSVATLQSWLIKCGFEHVKCVDSTATTTDEQRATPWMQYQSLTDFLAPSDPSKTIEGYPAPVRAVILANKKH